jgi:transcriptional regulator with XRE-family HTH domain
MPPVYPQWTTRSIVSRPIICGPSYPQKVEPWTDSDRQAFGRRLAEARDKKNKTQTEVGAMFDLGKQAVSSWEKGRNAPTAEQLARLAVEYDVGADWLLFGRSPKPARQFSGRALRLAALHDDSGEQLRNAIYAHAVMMSGLAGQPVSEAPVEPPAAPTPAQPRRQ